MPLSIYQLNVKSKTKSITFERLKSTTDNAARKATMRVGVSEKLAFNI